MEEIIRPLCKVPVPGMKASVKYHRGWGDLNWQLSKPRPFFTAKAQRTQRKTLRL